MVHGLDVVSVGVEHEGAVVMRVIDLPDAGSTVVAAAGTERGCMKSVDGRPICCRESDMDPSPRLTASNPEVWLCVATEPAHVLGGLHQELVAERSERG